MAENAHQAEEEGTTKHPWAKVSRRVGRRVERRVGRRVERRVGRRRCVGTKCGLERDGYLSSYLVVWGGADDTRHVRIDVCDGTTDALIE